MENDFRSNADSPLDIIQFHKQFAPEWEQFRLIESDSDEDSIEVHNEERPITPIEIAIRKAPTTLQELKELVHKRLQIRDDISTVKRQDQLQLAHILLSELHSVWPDICKQTPDPFLDTKDNRELERRVAVKIVTTIEDLYSQYIQKLKDANLKGVFSSSSNVSRLKTQLSDEANKSLNILKIRRMLAYDLKHPDRDDDNISEDSFVNKVREKILKTTTGLPAGRGARKLHLTRKHAEELNLALELKELEEKMPELDLKSVPNIEAQASILRKESSIPTTLSPEKKSITNATPSDEKAENEGLTGYDEILQFRLQNSNSLPQVDTAGQFLEELELDSADIMSGRKRSLDCFVFQSDLEREEMGKSVKGCSSISPREDLQNLISKEESSHKYGKTAESKDNISEEMPPLLQALPLKQKKIRHPDRDRILFADESSEYDSDASSTNEAAISALNKDNETINEVHPQPSVVSRKITKKDVVRTSDVRVSNRTNITQITLRKHLPLYNSFNSEIDDVTVKNLDSNLFAGEEIKEVYEEIAKTLNEEHLKFDKDQFVVKCPARLATADAKFSYSFTCSANSKVMNRNLIGRAQPPWDHRGADEWKKSPKFGGLDRMELLQRMENGERRVSKQDRLLEAVSQKKPTKLFSAWLAWWKSTINSDDFYKYVSTKENDFLSKIFHLYDSQDENDEGFGTSKHVIEDPETVARRLELQKKREELEAKKREYKEGYWNVHTVVLGGLGKEPEVTDESRSPSYNELVSSQLESDVSKGNDSDSQRLSKKPDEDHTDHLIPTQLTLQERIEQVWDKLKMPDKFRLDMAIKYSLRGNSALLEQAIDCWESAAESIAEREEIISALEKFEQAASDPNRFFEKGSKKSSLTRLEESKTRDALHKQLDKLDRSTKMALQAVKKKFKDTVTYQGRPYHEKMSVDRIEMLYWLQQERRAALMESPSMMEKKSKTTELPPIATINLL